MLGIRPKHLAPIITLYKDNMSISIVYNIVNIGWYMLSIQWLGICFLNKPSLLAFIR